MRDLDTRKNGELKIIVLMFVLFSLQKSSARSTLFAKTESYK